MSIARSRCRCQSNPGLGAIVAHTPHISIADVHRLYVGADRSGPPGAFDQLSGERDQFVLLGLRLRPGLLAGARLARTASWRPRPRSPHYGAAARRSPRTALRPRSSASRARSAKRRNFWRTSSSHQRLFGREVPVDRADPDARVTRNIVDLRIGAALREHRPCALEDPLAIAAGISALRAPGLTQGLGHGLFTRLVDNRNHSSL